ncbi:hypothetical protein V1520DRAFT_365342 [Lipomyces starkeyi]|uniref:Isopropylmalate dehydrogenase-like domain-containing protein n=1 Tax=Lipomyces starkeyi NRRL Y-11557 TaxID=675824 RepID=A0A1E3Q2I9_LIPST|nr:hypothetical protein LIPSTDRAFT_29033 [Lipomyces starkeyi NRRL Y-11557]
MPHEYKIASMPGDGIGPEVIDAALDVLDAVARYSGEFTLSFDNLLWGSDFYKATGTYLPSDGLETLKKYDAVLFGAVGAPDVPDSVSLWELLLTMRGSLQQYANVRPVKCLSSIEPVSRHVRPRDIDWMFVRENSEGEYAGQGGRTHSGFGWEVATEVAIFTRHGVRRIMRFAFETAASRPRKLLTVVTKSNAQRYGLVLWDEIAEEVSKEFPDVKWDKMLVDAMTVRMVRNPQSLDTIVGTNLHIDILSDLAAALAGSVGIAASANIDPTRKSPSMFEPVHGSAFDITGKGIANPLGAIWSSAMMLEWLGEKQGSMLVMNAIEKACAEGNTTGDLGGKLNTKQVTAAIISMLANPVRAYATGTTNVFPQFAEYGDFDNDLGLVNFEGGSLVMNVCSSRDNKHGHHSTTEVIGTKGRILVNGEPRILPVDISDEHGTRYLDQLDHMDHTDMFLPTFKAELARF